MSQQLTANERAFEAGGAIPLYARCVLGAGGTVTTAGLTDRELGTATRQAFASGDVIAVRLATAKGTHKMIANAAFASGDLVYTAAAGKVGASASTAYLLGRALDTAAADGDIIEVAYNSHGDTPVP